MTVLNLNFTELRGILRDINSKTKSTEESPVCLREFFKIIENEFQFHRGLKQDESVNFMMSFQNWMLRREYNSCKDKVKIGDIFYADLGINYKPEFSYHHPVIILEKIGNMYLVVPVSTTSSNVQDAYHPTDKPDGDKFLRKVYGNEIPTKSDGFERTGAVLLTDIKTVSQGRLLSKKGSLKNISQEGSLFREIKEKTFKLSFPKEQIKLLKTSQELEKAKVENEELRKANEELQEKYRILEEEIQKIEKSGKIDGT